jgi:beta-N-acetylhexosaminidase
MRQRAEAVIAAGSDVALHCNGNLREMEEVAEVVPQLLGEPLGRLERCLSALTAAVMPFDVAEAEQALGRILAAAV